MRRSLVQGLLTDVIARAALGAEPRSGAFLFSGSCAGSAVLRFWAMMSIRRSDGREGKAVASFFALEPPATKSRTTQLNVGGGGRRRRKSTWRTKRGI
ncbi:hypothetical protein BO83DRAFT_176235 [Aspergillus eucalypticola CBS 122712]|uniref:Uncharacterized protein n=1 Tax=Aspergillus eucalypticola (strain CBS 122712 / IBT 29274) TaxID=1448314 RepID=A0A317W5Q5_ASPEC|nr:uncharacterized protein BO83DRAFT_176235 [Aspergillus eucalypticola CBS 122712]PWY81409.1 hypothetical protein BO83DRAFT_176235 [Aspergillus eucalypticola CBS 122712]